MIGYVRLSSLTGNAGTNIPFEDPANSLASARHE